MYKRLLLLLVVFSLLVGCGGGGGSTAGTSTAYVGVTTQATVTTANARALSVDAYTGSQFSSVASPGKEVIGDNSPSILQETAGILERSVAIGLNEPKARAKVAAATAQDTIYGYSGSFSYTINVDQSSGAFSGTMTFSQYMDSSTSAIISGSIALSGVYNSASRSFTSLNISMSNLSGTSGGKSYSLAGTMSFGTSGTTQIVNMSVVLTDNLSGRTYWEKDFTLALTGNSLTMTGTYYDPVHGYVVISTVTPLNVSTFDGTPISGQLLSTGSNGTKARLTFTSSGYVVEADTNGNGTYVVVPPSQRNQGSSLT